MERIRREGGLLDPHVANAALVLEPRGRDLLERIARSYLAVAERHGLPMLLLTPTWRANPERARLAGHGDGAGLNGEAARFLRGLARRSSAPGPLFVGGLLGCRGDAYRPEEGLRSSDAERFHRPQAEALAAAGVDFLLAATMPAVPEAAGMARALSRTGLPYVVSFVVRETGRLLDGTPLDDAIEEVDRAASPSPAAFLVNCVHPAVLRRALSTPCAARSASRLAGLQGNASTLPPEELDGRPELDGTGPEPFAEEMDALRRESGLRILGGCCGTDDRYLEALARRLSRSPTA